MDEITLFTALRPAPPTDADQIGRAARARLARAYRRTPRHRRWPLILATGGIILAGTVTLAVPAIIPSHNEGRLITSAWTVQVNRDHTVTITIKRLHDPAGLQRALRHAGIPALVRYILPATTAHSPGVPATRPSPIYASCTWPASAHLPASVARRVFPHVLLEPGGVALAPPAFKTLKTPRPSVSPIAIPRSRVLFLFTIRPQFIPRGAVVFIADYDIPHADVPAAGFGLFLLVRDHLPKLRCLPATPWLVPKVAD
jgi:hypothetical protein